MTTQTTNQINHTLQSVLPSYTGITRNANDNGDGDGPGFPKPLVQLTHALLQQSRARVPSLKPEEEAGRWFVVAEIACHRLKTRLNLPKIESRPPCPPKVYKKLYSYLESVLRDEKKEDAIDDGVATPVTTPSKRGANGASSVKASKAGANQNSKSIGATLDRELPVHSPPAGKRTGGTAENAGSGLTPAQKRRKLDNQQYDPRTSASDELVDEEEGESQGEEEQFVDAEETFGDEERDEESGAKVIGASHQVGRGSVMESRFDWLSDERQREFAQWKSDILKRIDDMERKKMTTESPPKAGAV